MEAGRAACPGCGETILSTAVEAAARWQKSAPDDGFAKRSIEFLKREGLGDVYFAPVDLDFENCEIQTPSKLVLEIGDEAKNTIKLE